MKKMWKKPASLLMDAIYPRRCPVCDGIVFFRGSLICPSCFQKLSFVKSPTCKKCGKEVENETIEYCYDCARHVHNFRYGMSLLNYNEAAAHSMAQIKYHNKREYLDFYGKAAAVRFGERLRRISPDGIVPVPVHPSKEKIRGYNQAELFARVIGRELDIPVLADLLVRTRKTEPQKELSPRERFQNLKDAFEAGPIPEGIQKILLADDIYTTGSTIEACTRALEKRGIKEIYFLTICIGYGR